MCRKYFFWSKLSVMQRKQEIIFFTIIANYARNHEVFTYVFVYLKNLM